MNIDKWEEVINREGTYKKIAEELLTTGKCIIGWTDQGYEHRDIMFTYQPKHLGGGLQGGLKWCYLYVSIMRFRCNGFLIETNRDNTQYAGYIMEKLRLEANDCDFKICELINGVIHEIDLKEGNIENEIN